MNLNIEDLKNQQRWLVKKGRELLSKEEGKDIPSNSPHLLGKIDEGRAIVDLIQLVDTIITESEVYGEEEFTIKMKKSP